MQVFQWNQFPNFLQKKLWESSINKRSVRKGNCSNFNGKRAYKLKLNYNSPDPEPPRRALLVADELYPHLVALRQGGEHQGVVDYKVL